MGPFRILGSGLKTHVYIDGYNLYYGRLRSTDYKWLDVGALARRIVHAQDPASDVRCIRYFTAPALARYARRGDASVAAQSAYHRALDWVHLRQTDGDNHRAVVYAPDQAPPSFQIIYGKHELRGNISRPQFVEGEPPSKEKLVPIWEITEKETDVNLALTMYRDVAKGFAQQVVLFSRDSDALPALRALREDFPDLVIGVVAPVKAREDYELESLAKIANWHRNSISDQDLVECQLPNTVTRQGEKGVRKGKPAILRPAHWAPGHP